jgi:hypothetical protein
MNAPVRKQGIAVDPVAVLIARAQARALLWAAGEIDLHAAVDELWADAVRDGLTDKLGTDKVQQLLADAFASERDDLPRHDDAVPDELVADERVADVPTATLRAAEYLVQQKDPARLKAWLARHSRAERAAIRKHLQNKRGPSCR